MKDIYRKLLFFVIVVFVYQNIIIIILAPEVYSEPLYVVYLLFMYIISLTDTLIRPMTEEQNESKKFVIILLSIFLLQPFILIVAYYENELLILKHLPVWDSLIITYIGFVIYFVAAMIELIARTQLGRFATGVLIIEKEHKLFKGGIYRYIRHPIYTGGILGVIGFSLIFNTIITLIVITCMYFLVFKMRIDEEEKILTQEFGNEYEEYKKTTKKLFPFIY